jgi:hypothetical protein
LDSETIQEARYIVYHDPAVCVVALWFFAFAVAPAIQCNDPTLPGQPVEDSWLDPTKLDAARNAGDQYNWFTLPRFHVANLDAVGIEEVFHRTYTTVISHGLPLRNQPIKAKEIIFNGQHFHTVETGLTRIAPERFLEPRIPPAVRAIPSHTVNARFCLLRFRHGSGPGFAKNVSLKQPQHGSGFDVLI